MTDGNPDWSEACKVRSPNISPYRLPDWDIQGFYYPARPFPERAYAGMSTDRPPRPWRHS